MQDLLDRRVTLNLATLHPVVAAEHKQHTDEAEHTSPSHQPALQGAAVVARRRQALS